MPKVLVNLDTKEICEVLTQLPAKQRDSIARTLWVTQLDDFVTDLRKRADENRITKKDIDKMCKDARRNIYEQRQKCRN